MSKQNLSEQKAVAAPADLFARKGSGKPAGLLIPYERKAGTARDAKVGTARDAKAGTATGAETAAESGDQGRPPEIIGGAGSLLTVIEFRKPAPGSAAVAKPQGKGIAELSQA